MYLLIILNLKDIKSLLIDKIILNLLSLIKLCFKKYLILSLQFDINKN